MIVSIREISTKKKTAFKFFKRVFIPTIAHTFLAVIGLCGEVNKQQILTWMFINDWLAGMNSIGDIHDGRAWVKYINVNMNMKIIEIWFNACNTKKIHVMWIIVGGTSGCGENKNKHRTEDGGSAGRMIREQIETQHRLAETEATVSFNCLSNGNRMNFHVIN